MADKLIPLVVDANVLVMECLRKRGRAPLSTVNYDLHMSDRAAGEFLHESSKRLSLLALNARLTDAEEAELHSEVLEMFARLITIIPASEFMQHEQSARTRIPTDPDDWPSVALALMLDAALWTEDRDFFGCGLRVWRTDVLYAVAMLADDRE